MANVDKYLSNGQIDNKWREQNRREHVILINSDKSKTVDSSFVYLLRHHDLIRSHLKTYHLHSAS